MMMMIHTYKKRERKSGGHLDQGCSWKRPKKKIKNIGEEKKEKKEKKGKTIAKEKSMKTGRERKKEKSALRFLLNFDIMWVQILDEGKCFALTIRSCRRLLPSILAAVARRENFGLLLLLLVVVVIGPSTGCLRSRLKDGEGRALEICMFFSLRSRLMA